MAHQAARSKHIIRFWPNTVENIDRSILDRSCLIRITQILLIIRGVNTIVSRLGEHVDLCRVTFRTYSK